MFIDRSKFLEQFLKRVTQGKFLWNSQNLTCAFKAEDFLRIRSCSYSESSPYSLEPCLMTDHNFANNFWERSLKKHFCEIISKSDQRFLRRFFKNFLMSVYWKKHPFTRAMFIDGSKFHKQILKRVTQGAFMWNYFKIWPAVSEEKIF